MDRPLSRPATAVTILALLPLAIQLFVAVHEAGHALAALALGAQGVQLGSRFLLTRESGANRGYRARLASAADTDTEIITAFSGRPARGLRNRVLDVLEQAGEPAAGWPRQSALWADIRAEADRRGSADHTTLWAGQAAGMAEDTDTGAGDVLHQIVEEAEATLRRLTARSWR